MQGIYKEVDMDNNYRFTSTLWNIMQIFGSEMFIGSDSPFQNNEIEIEI